MYCNTRFSRSPGPRAQRTDGDGPNQQPDIVAMGQTGKTGNRDRVQSGDTDGGRTMLETGTIPLGARRHHNIETKPITPKT